MLSALPYDAIENILSFLHRYAELCAVSLLSTELRHACREVRVSLLLTDYNFGGEQTTTVLEWTKALDSVLQNLANIVSLTIRRCNVDDLSLSRFLASECCSRLEEMNLIECRYLTNENSLLKQVASCRSLAFSKCSKMAKYILPSLARTAQTTTECLALDGLIHEVDEETSVAATFFTQVADGEAPCEDDGKEVRDDKGEEKQDISNVNSSESLEQKVDESENKTENVQKDGDIDHFLRQPEQIDEKVEAHFNEQQLGLGEIADDVSLRNFDDLSLDDVIETFNDMNISGNLQKGRFSSIRTLVLTNNTILNWDFLSSLINLENLFLGGSCVNWASLSRNIRNKKGKPIKLLEVTFHSSSQNELEMEMLPSTVEIIDFLEPENISFSPLDHGEFYQSAVSVAIDCRNQWAETPLHKAVRDKSIEKVKKHIQFGCHINATDMKCNAPLMVACELGFCEIVEVLLAHGANKTALNQRRETPLFIACLKGHLKVVEFLLSSVDDPISVFNDEELYCNGWTPVMAACVNKNVEILDFLLKNGMKFNHQNRYGLTPLHVCCHSDFVEGVKLLLGVYSVVDVNTKEEYGKTALDFAYEKRRREIIQLLLGAGGTARTQRRKPKTKPKTKKRTKAGGAGKKRSSKGRGRRRRNR